MHKIIRGIFTFLTAGLFMTVATYAAFSAQSINKNNAIKAGTVILQADSKTEISGVQTTPIFDNLKDIKAGDSISREIYIQNSGTLGLTYGPSIIKVSGDEVLFNAFRMKVGTISGLGDLYDGSMSGFFGFIGGNRYLASGVGEKLYFTLSLPADSGESLEGKSLTTDFIFNATQSP